MVHKKIAVVLFNLGGPDSRNAIRPFLQNFFMDRNIINLPIPLRCLLAWRISSRRSKKEALDSYEKIGNKSPLLENTNAQACALENYLNVSDTEVTYKAFVCMRYWHPMAAQVVREVKNWSPDKVILLPLYPQFSTTTTWSSLENWNKASHIADYNPETAIICCYPFNQNFVKASAKNILDSYIRAQQEGYDNIRVLFSAHGLPEKIIKNGDPYQWQCEQSAIRISQELSQLLNINDLDWKICYQSRVGPMKWIGPSIDEALQEAAKDNKSVIIYPHAFTQEHVETLVELDFEYSHVAKNLGIKAYYRASTVGIDSMFIEGLRDLVLKHKKSVGIVSESDQSICPEGFTRCCMRNQSR